MGKKHKKQMRQERVKATHETQKKQLLKSKKKPRKNEPIWQQPVIVFVRGGDYEPVKYAMKESREIEPEQIAAVAPDGSPEADVEAVEPEPELESEDEPELGESEPESGESERNSYEMERKTYELERDSEFDFDLPDFDSDNELGPDHPGSQPGSHPGSHPGSPGSGSSFDLCDDLDSDAEPLSLSLGHQIDPRFEEMHSDSDPEMEMDIDYNDMEIDDLVNFGHGIDDDYSYEMEVDSDADDIISALLSGASLDQFERKSKQYNKQKPKLTKRRKERLDARDAARAANFGKGPALWQKYPTGMSVHEVVEEMQILVATPNLQEIQFPPLDHNANWYVEQFANLHNLKSKSFTKNHANCIRVIKTSRSGPPEYNKLQRLLRRRQHFPRVDVDQPARESKHEAKHKTSRPKEGDIVGHNAQALNHGFGHKMLLEMGWSSGSGLGLLRDGIQAPLLARVKLTKRGL